MKNINMDKAGFISNIKARYLQGELTRDEAKEIIRSSYKNITAQEFAMGEQELSNLGVSEDEITRRLPEIMDIFEEFLVADPLGVQQGHPLDSYQKEIDIFKETFRQLERLSKNKFIINPYLEQYDKLKGLKIHLDRKQNQLYSALEKAGFDMPSKIMWTLDNALQKTVKEAVMALLSGEEAKFLEKNQQVIAQGLDLMSKEENILLPTALELIDDQEFVQMRQGDDEIGYALITNPPGYKNSHQSAESAAIANAPGGFIQELGALLSKYQMGNPEEELDVSQGKLSLERINLIFKHLPVDLSYVDENEIVKFYSDTKERVFPRSPGVIGRKVQNCHPRESVDTVEEIIKAFRNNEQNQAEFWLPMGDQFIYIIYIAVRDEKGQFKGVLEMMQNATRVRSLEGKQTLLSWGIAPKSDTMAVDTVEQTAKDKADDSKENQQQQFKDSAHHNEKDSDNPLSKETILGELLKRYPGLKDHLLTLSPKYNKLNNPLIFNAMKNVATLEMIAHRGGFQVEELIELIEQWINNLR